MVKMLRPSVVLERRDVSHAPGSWVRGRPIAHVTRPAATRLPSVHVWPLARTFCGVSKRNSPTLAQRWSTNPWPGLLLAIVGAASFAAAVAIGDGDPETPAPWYQLVVIFVAVFAFVGAVLLLSRWNDRRSLARNPANRTRQVQELKTALDKALSIVTAFRDEIAERDRLLQELEEKVENRRALAQLDAPEVDAVVDQLRSELRREGRRGLARDVVLGAFFFGAGIAATRLTG